MSKKTIAILLVTLMLTAVGISACGNVKTDPSNKEDKKTEEKIKEDKKTGEKQDAKEVVQAEQASIKPQDDFFNYVKKEMVKKEDNNDPESSWDHLSDMEQKINEDLDKLKEELKTKAADQMTDTEKGVSNLIGTAEDYETRNKVGLGSLKEYLDVLSNAKSIPEYLDAMAKIQKELGNNSLINIKPEADAKDSSNYILYMEDPNLLIEKDYFGDDQTLESMKAYIKNLLIAYGKDEKEADEWSQKLLDFQKQIADNALSKAEKYDLDKVLNYYTAEKLQSELPNVDVASYLEKTAKNNLEKIIVSNPNMLKQINSYLTEENLELLKNYSIVSLLNNYSAYLNKDFSTAKAEFNYEDSEDSAMAWKSVSQIAEKEVGELYAKKYFSPEKKQAVEKIVKDIIEAYKVKIGKLDWMSEEGKAGAIKKLETMVLKIAYPENYVTWTGENILKSKEENGNLIDNVVAINKWAAQKDIEKASKPVDRTEWGLSPQTLNGYYDHLMNDIVIPAAMLQAPFYDENQSYAKNLGGIGAMIAHEVTHAFDDNGSKYDEKGNLNQWWSDSDHQEFNKRTEKIVKYFGNIEVLPGQKVNGEATMGENIADLGSISTISSIVENDTEALKELYTNYAYTLSNITSEQSLSEQLQSDEHSPNIVRVNGVLSSTEGFYKAFDVKKGDKMYVEPSERVGIY